MSAAAPTPPAAPALRIGINLDGVLVHDGLMTPLPQTRLAWVRHSQSFDYIEKNMDPREDFEPYFRWVDQYGVPIEVFGGIFCAGQDEHRMRWGLRTGGQLGARVFNMQLYARHCDGHAISDREVADFFLQAMEHGTQNGCLPTLEVHVDMWSERFDRIESVANLLAQSHVDLRLTLDHSHLIFKIDNPQELHMSGVEAGTDGGRSRLAPANPQAYYTQWLNAGWVVHAHTRSVATGIQANPLGKRSRDVAGRAIQYPLLAPAARDFHSHWKEEHLQEWKTAVQEMLLHMHTHGGPEPTRISCEFIPFADYGGGARYSIWDNNLACAHWLRQQWAALG